VLEPFKQNCQLAAYICRALVQEHVSAAYNLYIKEVEIKLDYVLLCSKCKYR